MENQSALLISIMAPTDFTSSLLMEVNCVILVIYLLLGKMIDSGWL
jgi:hypothetical protein